MREIKFEIVNVSLNDLNLKDFNFPLKRNKNYPFAFLFVPVRYAQQGTNIGIFKFKFFLETGDVNRIGLVGICDVLSDYQNEIESSLKNKNKKLVGIFFEKVMYKCFLKSKEILEEEGLPFPEINWILEQIKKYKKG